MPLLPILSLPDPRLRLVSKRVEAFDEDLRRLLDDMLETMYAAPGIGLAGIQVGVDRRVVTIDLSRKPEEEKQPMRIVNPEIVWASEEKFEYEEGCLSIPEFYENVTRPAKVRVRYQDETGAAREIEASGLLATALQHEIDHLNGVLFIDHISRLKRERVVKKFVKAARREAGEEADAAG